MKTSQLILPKSVTTAVGAGGYFEIEVRNGQIVLIPIRIQQADAVRAKRAELIWALTYPRFKLTVSEQEELLADYLPYCLATVIPILHPVVIRRIYRFCNWLWLIKQMY